MRCATCHGDLPKTIKPGPSRTYCSSACRQKAYYQRKKARRAAAPSIPDRLTALPQWVRADGKRPITTEGRSASSTNPRTWTTHAAVTAPGAAGDGFGVMCGRGVACIDIDGGLTDSGDLTTTARLILDACPGAWVERSVSGRGLHIFGSALERPGRAMTAPDGVGVEIYTRARFIRVTADTYRPGDLVPLDLDRVVAIARGAHVT